MYMYISYMYVGSIFGNCNTLSLAGSSLSALKSLVTDIRVTCYYMHMYMYITCTVLQHI